MQMLVQCFYVRIVCMFVYKRERALRSIFVFGVDIKTWVAFPAVDYCRLAPGTESSWVPEELDSVSDSERIGAGRKWVWREDSDV